LIDQTECVILAGDFGEPERELLRKTLLEAGVSVFIHKNANLVILLAISGTFVQNPPYFICGEGLIVK